MSIEDSVKVVRTVGQRCDVKNEEGDIVALRRRVPVTVSLVSIARKHTSVRKNEVRVTFVKAFLKSERNTVLSVLAGRSSSHVVIRSVEQILHLFWT
jgi:hypothetical protein